MPINPATKPVRLATPKSRLIATGSAAFILFCYFIFGWGAPFIPDYIAFGSIAVAIVLLYWARQVRETEGKILVIADNIKGEFSKIASLEVTVAVIFSLLSLIALFSFEYTQSKVTQRALFVASGLVILLSALIGIYSNQRLRKVIDACR